MDLGCTWSRQIKESSNRLPWIIFQNVQQMVGRLPARRNSNHRRSGFKPCGTRAPLKNLGRSILVCRRSKRWSITHTTKEDYSNFKLPDRNNLLGHGTPRSFNSTIRNNQLAINILLRNFHYTSNSFNLATINASNFQS